MIVIDFLKHFKRKYLTSYPHYMIGYYYEDVWYFKNRKNAFNGFIIKIKPSKFEGKNLKIGLEFLNQHKIITDSNLIRKLERKRKLLQWEI